MSDWPDSRTLGAVLYPGFDLLDLTGPLHAFGMLKNVFEQVLVGPEAGPVESAQGPAIMAEVGQEDAPKLDILLVPGGSGTRRQAQDEPFLRWLAMRAEDAELVLSVSSGAGLLAAAGVLDGRRATTGSRAAAWVHEQGPRVRWVNKARYVDDGDVVTAAGVASGIDMALHVITRLTAEDVGENVARSLEYVWPRDPKHDPFAS
jgi:transcriptional regulator GlxA family with amidase domain